MGTALLEGNGGVRRSVLTGGCSNVATVVAGDGPPHWVIASVSDDPYDVRTRVVVDRDGPLAYVATELQPAYDTGMTERGYVVAEGERGRGVNEAGFALCWAYVDEREVDPTSAGLTSGGFTRKLLAECASVAEALAIIEGADRNFAGAWFFADGDGDFAQVEIGRSAFVVVDRRDPSPGNFAINVNCYQDETMAPLQQPWGALDVEAAPNGARRAAAAAALGGLGRPAKLADVAEVLSDHVGAAHAGAAEPWVFPSQGFSVCNHGTYGPGAPDGAVAFGTVSAEILDPRTRTLWYCYGWPCGEREAAADQPFQDRSWGRFLPFALDVLPAGPMTTIEGDLTAEAARVLDTADELVRTRAAEARA
jgi:hypothetical protein